MRKRNLAASAAVVALVAAMWTTAPAQAKQDPVPFGTAHCAALTGLEVSAKAIDLPTTGAVVTEALWVHNRFTPANLRHSGRPRPTTARPGGARRP